MADDPYSALLGLPSPEAEAVSRILQPREPAEKTVYGDPFMQSGADYGDRLEADLRRRQDLAARAEMQRRMPLPTVTGMRARTEAYRKAMEEAVYERDTGLLLKDLQAIDPGDPDAMSMQDEVIAKHKISRHALKDPRVANIVKRQAEENEEMQALFEQDPDARKEYTRLRAENVEPKKAREAVRMSAMRRADRLAYAAAGGDPVEFDSGKFDGPDGRVDKAKMAFEIAKLKKEKDAPKLMASELSKIATLKEAIRKGESEMKSYDSDEAYWNALKNVLDTEEKPKTKEEWDAAYAKLKAKKVGEPQAAYDEYVTMLEELGKPVPKNENHAQTKISDKAGIVPPSVPQYPSAGTLSPVQESQERNAPPGLSQAGTGGLAVQETSPYNPQNTTLSNGRGNSGQAGGSTEKVSIGGNRVGINNAAVNYYLNKAKKTP